VLLTATGLAVPFGRASAIVGSAPQSVPQEVPAIFRPFYQGYSASEEQLKAARAALPYDRVSLQRSGGMVVPSGAFTLTLSRSGEATLSTDAAGAFGRTGEWVGKVSIFDFGKISHLMSQIGFEHLGQRYAVNQTDLHTFTVSVATAHGAFAVADYGGAGPVELWSVEQSIKGIGSDIAWKKK
jgi:hypothetical protein